ncbi:hypothetical protein [Streptomyces sp. NPDC017520]|uniref:hypothetical protein n=1 Tax=Streptomyces sp. NPDC017520 TaxID=3364998 RepID=UPI00379C43EB
MSVTSTRSRSGPYSTVTAAVPLALGGLLIAVAGALLPAGRGARARTATALRTEEETGLRPARPAVAS